MAAYEKKVGVLQQSRPNGSATTSIEASPYFASMMEKLQHDYLFYKINENYNITFINWLKQPMYKIERDIEMIKRVAVELNKIPE